MDQRRSFPGDRCGLTTFLHYRNTVDAAWSEHCGKLAVRRVLESFLNGCVSCGRPGLKRLILCRSRKIPCCERSRSYTPSRCRHAVAFNFRNVCRSTTLCTSLRPGPHRKWTQEGTLPSASRSSPNPSLPHLRLYGISGPQLEVDYSQSCRATTEQRNLRRRGAKLAKVSGSQHSNSTRKHISIFGTEAGQSVADAPNLRMCKL